MRASGSCAGSRPASGSWRAAGSCSIIEPIGALCLRRRLIVFLVTIIVCGYGVYSWLQLKIEACPEIGDVTVIVPSKATGLAAEEVERQIAIPLEPALA